MTPTRTAASAATLAIAAALALTGCSGGGTTTPAAADETTAGGGAPAAGVPDACSLLTPSDIAGVIDGSYGEAQHNDQLSNEYQDVCEWFSSNGAATFVQVFAAPGGDQVDSQRATADDAMGPATDVTVPGATGAYSVASGSILGMAVGDTYVQVSNVQSTSDDLTAQTVALAAIVAGNV